MNYLTSDLLFYFFAAIAVIAAILVVMKRNPVGSAMCMAVSFAATAGIMFILGAHFLGVIQILVYTGAIMVLFLFIIMLLNVKAEEKSFRRPLPVIIGLVVIAVFMLQLGGVIYSIPGAKETHHCPLAQTCQAVDELCITDKAMIREFCSCGEPLTNNDDVKVKEPGAILDVSLIKAHDKLRRKEVEITMAVREPVIIVGKDGTTFIALEKSESVKDGDQETTNSQITILDEKGDVISANSKKLLGIPEDIKKALASKSVSCDTAQPELVGANKDVPVGVSRPIGSSPRMTLPDIEPGISALSYPPGSAIRTAIDKGEFPDTALLGQQIFLKYNMAFVIVGLSLLVATIGVVVLCRKFNKD